LCKINHHIFFNTENPQKRKAETDEVPTKAKKTKISDEAKVDIKQDLNSKVSGKLKILSEVNVVKDS